MEDFVIGRVAKQLGVGPADFSVEHRQYIFKIFNVIDHTLFKQHDINDVGDVLGKVLADAFNKKFTIRKSNDEIDIHEFQKRILETEDTDRSGLSSEIGDYPAVYPDTKSIRINDIFGSKTIVADPNSIYEYHYLVLDSEYRNKAGELSTIQKYTWRYTPTQNLRDGFCNSTNDISNIISMRIYQPRIPYLSSMNADYKCVSILIEEFAAQAMISPSGRRYHFLLRPAFISQQTDVELSADDPSDYIFNFRKPITTFDTLTLTFGGPYDLLSFSASANKFMFAIEFTCLKSNKYLNDFTNENDTAINASVSSLLLAKSQSELALPITTLYTQPNVIYNMKSRYYYTYLTLDSSNCEFNETRDKFRWLLHEENPIYKHGTIDTHAKFRNIIAARLGNIHTTHMPTGFATDAVAGARYGFGFEEFISQALISPNGNKYQFITSIRSNDSNYGTNITLSAFDHNRGWFRFREPYAMLNSLTLNIYNLVSDTKITLPDEYTSFSAVKHSGNTYVRIITNYYNTFTISNGNIYLPYSLLTGNGATNYFSTSTVAELVRFSGFNTGDPVLDAMYNNQLMQLKWIYQTEFFIQSEQTLIFSGPPPGWTGDYYFDAGAPAQPFPTGDYPLTITLIYKPKFIGVLELISEYEGDL